MKRTKLIDPKDFTFKQHMSELLKLPADLTFQDPVVTLLGRRQLRIENYQNLIKYQSDTIVVRVHLCKLIITGNHLIINSYTNDEMHISGEIYSISYEN